MSTPTDTRYSAPALEKGLDIIEHLAGQSMPRSKADIGEALDRTPSEIYRMLSVLEQRGYVRKQEGTAAYSLSLKLFELGHLQNTMSTLRKAIRIPMEQLANHIGQGCHFSVQNGNNLLVMMERMPARRICLAVGEGTLLPITQAASGAMMLSQLPADETQTFLEKDAHYNDLSKAAQKKLIDRIQQIRREGQEIAESQITGGVIDIALPVGIPNTELFGTLAVSCLETNLNAPSIAKSLKAMKACVQSINSNLGIE